MKKTIIIIAVLFLTNIFISDVSASIVECPYKLKTGNGELVTAIDTQSDGLGTFTFNDETMYYGNDVSLIHSDYFRPFSKAANAVDYINNNGGFSGNSVLCPPYFYVYNDPTGSGYKYGYFSDKSESKNISNLKVVYEFSSIAQEPSTGPNGEVVPEDKINTCELSTNEQDFKTVAKINVTKSKIDFTSGLFNNKSEYEQKYDYTIDCPKDLFVCYNRYTDSTTRIYYLVDSASKSNYGVEYICNPLVKSSEVKVGTKYCEIFYDLYSEYNNISSSENSGLKYDKLNQLKSFCSNVLQNSDFDSYEESCINKCLHLSESLDIYNGTDDGECGLSNVLLKWILNIIKWVKYIIPVIVILMGILDFIRAVATDKDDGMKKAQGRFVKRLIAAALIFVVPFILEFILEKFGFNVEGCRVIKF